ncbi:hypothetical protein R3P38DRAFT_3173240 [Favolaschia claudopus]|uniref:Uncharacterized protein n=1 Tax=Favolaschia claudopus TaxID=2862362 RepID=A0AAW0DBW0_9AGAR
MWNANESLPSNGSLDRDKDETSEINQNHKDEKHKQRKKFRNRFLDVSADESDGEGGKVRNRDESSDDEERLSDREFVDDSLQYNASSVYTGHNEDSTSDLSPASSFRRRAAAYAAGIAQEVGETRHQNTERGATPPWVLRQCTPPPLAEFITGASAALAVKARLGDWVRIRTGGHHRLLGFTIDPDTFLVSNQKTCPTPAKADRARNSFKATSDVFPAIHHKATNPSHLQSLRILDPSKVSPIVPPAWYELAPRQRLPHQSLLECVSFEELTPFLRDPHPALLSLTHHADSPALAEGDRVVAVAGTHKGRDGFIARVRKDAASGERYAYLAPMRDGGYCLDATPDSETLMVKLSHLRRHALDFSYAFENNDRVQSVSSGATGRVAEVDYQNLLVYVARENGSRFKVGIDEAVRMWEPGDCVRVRWGEFFLRAGFIVNVVRGGFLDVFDPHFPVLSEPNQWSEENKFRVRAADVDFDKYEDDSLSSTAPQRETPWVETGDMQGGKNRLRHLQVQITGKHFYKGIRGMIVADHNDGQRTARLRDAEARDAEGLGNPEYGLEKLNMEGILLTIRKDGTNELVQDIRIEDVVHEQTMLPLIQALALPRAILNARQAPSQLYGFPAEVPPPRPSTPHTSSNIESAEEPCLPTFNERDGSWLSIAELNMKRLDVQIVGTDNLKNASKKLKRCKGQFGHLLLEVPIDALDDKVVVYGVGPSSIRPSVPKQCIIPRRENDVGERLWEIRERVVVLGPDVWGDASRRGMYAETMPEVDHGLGPEIVAVVFEGGREAGFFHACHLCLSRNVFVDDDFPSSVFK